MRKRISKLEAVVINRKLQNQRYFFSYVNKEENYVRVTEGSKELFVGNLEEFEEFKKKFNNHVFILHSIPRPHYKN
ncbi:MAG: hypothetical protein K0S51_2280 [Bacillales bacterium]|jgi:hypothetical protein|nr:hypothetical protein [Bacillales bacterium]